VDLIDQWFPTRGARTPGSTDRLRVHENNIGNGGKQKKNGVKIKTQKQSL
jgi:hypothetical protein